MKKQDTLIAVFNSKNQLLLQLRAKHDDKYPGHWDFSAGGGIDDGEKPHDAAKRELKEELGFEADLEFITEIDYSGPLGERKGPVVDSDLYLFRLRYDGPFTPNPEEVAELKFFNIEAVDEMIKNHEESFHPEFVFVFKKYRQYFKL